MKIKKLWLLPLVLAVLLVAAFTKTTFSKHTKMPYSQTGFAVVELFTSEGCSSCPAADEAVAAVSKKYGNNVYVLAFHVDYWDRLGWKDLYSEAAYTKRQSNYASLFRLQSIYTPQVIVNGKKQFVGSDKALLEATINTELKNTPDQVINLAAVKNEGKQILVTYKVAKAIDELLHVALIQLAAETDVKRGENGGRKLHHINIVRDYQTIALQKAAAGSIQLITPPALANNEFKVIAYLQNNTNGHITCATESIIQ